MLWTPLLPRCVSLLAAEMRYKLLMNEKRIQDKRKTPEEGDGEAPGGTDEGKSKSKQAKQAKKATENPEEKTQAVKEKTQKKEKKKKLTRGSPSFSHDIQWLIVKSALQGSFDCIFPFATEVWFCFIKC